MLLTPQFLDAVFSKALPYNKYVATGSEDQQQRWQQVFDSVALSVEQEKLLETFSRDMNIIFVSGVWCGDCIEQGPLLARIAQGSPMIRLRFLDRDAIVELTDNLTINSGKRVPVALFMAEDFALCSIYGDRTLSRYRALAQRQFGPSCSTGLFVPDADELKSTLQDWLGECERVQLMLRLSTRLREKYND